MKKVLVPAIVSASLFLWGFGQIIDRVVAVVNDKVITLTDIKIAAAFGLYDPEGERGTGVENERILKALIDQKVVLDLAQENVSLDPSEIREEFDKAVARLGREGFQKRLDEFGLDEASIRPYLEEKRLLEKIIAMRFNQRSVVSLQEIETYYRETYVPQERSNGREPQPMVQILDKLEAGIREAKRAEQVASWIENLRSQADIHISKDPLK